MATLRERLRARREAERRGLRSFTIGVSEDDLRVIAKHGYGGALSTDYEQKAEAVRRFITDALAAPFDSKPGSAEYTKVQLCQKAESSTPKNIT